MNYEYTVSTTPDFVTTGHLNSHGGEGWELVTIISRPGLPERAVFKRPVAATKSPRATKKGAK